MPASDAATTQQGSMKDKYGPWAVIAGASHGVGEELARQIAALGINCVLLARRESVLKELQVEIENNYGIETRVLPIDLATEDAPEKIIDALDDLEVNLLVYNAGSPPYASEFLNAPLEDWMNVVKLNVTTVVELCYKFAPKMIERGHGGLLLVGSQAALGGNKKYAMYTGTKGFMLNFGESLWIECASKGVDVLNLLIQTADTPSLRKQMKLSNIPGWDQEDIGVPKSADLARIGLRELGNGPTFVHPQDEETGPGQLTMGAERREAMVERWRLTAPFVGDD